MEALLPSEIARLVFGYLEDQKCDEAARSFLEMSPHLHECRSVFSSGRRFNTRVNGLTLVDIIEKFSAAHTLVQERLSKVADCEQVRHCGDLLEQLRFLVGGSRGQRFVVNINVPSQTSTQVSGGSPIISSSIRKRHLSGSDRERNKRTLKPLHQLFEKQSEPVSSQLGCDTVEATPLESLPGHADFSRSSNSQKPAADTQEGDGAFCTSTKNDFVDCLHSVKGGSFTLQTCTHHARSSLQAIEKGNSGGISERRKSEPALNGRDKEDRDLAIRTGEGIRPKGKSMATSTEELTSYSCAEVQTTPYAPSESESTDEPIENLSLLTKELLNRTELQERIAENINKAILPAEMASKDESLTESLCGELNHSIMTELSNAIKSIVQATETDPVFEQFLDEIIGPSMEIDTSPDEDADAKLRTEPVADYTRVPEERPSIPIIEMDSQAAAADSNDCKSETIATDVPLKQRLRSSSRQQNNKTEDEGDRQKDRERRDSSLEDQNAAAILSIINIIDSKPTDDKNITNERVTTSTMNVDHRNKIVEKQSTIVPKGTESAIISSAPIVSEHQITHSTEVVANHTTECKSTKKALTKRPRHMKPPSQLEINNDNLISEQEMMAMPTLIVCSNEEINRLITMKPLYTPGNTTIPSSTSAAHFIPIAPKDSNTSEPVTQPIYLRTVKVPPKIEPPIITEKIVPREQKVPLPPRTLLSAKKRSRKVTKKSKNAKIRNTAVKSIKTADNNTTAEAVKHSNATPIESITLYGNENSAGTTLETGSLPTINLDESISLTGTGLSPFLKFKDGGSKQAKDETVLEEPVIKVPTQGIDSEKTDMAEQPVANINTEEMPLTFAHSESILLTKRTPKSLLKSRSKNKRLSMSTPRRRSSHIRALDFGTPIKMSSSDHKGDGTENVQFSPKSTNRSRSVCRSSLFKSPPFSNPTIAGQKLKTPTKSCQLYKVPIATRSPTTKLMGGWEKYTGVGMIIGVTSPHAASTTGSSGQHRSRSTTKLPRITTKKCWDADLRKVLEKYQEESATSSSSRKGTLKKDSAKDKSGIGKTRDKVIDATEKIENNRKSKDRCSSVINDNKLISEESNANSKNIEEVKVSCEIETVPRPEENADASKRPIQNSFGDRNTGLMKEVITEEAVINIPPVQNTAKSSDVIQPISSDSLKICENVDHKLKETDKSIEKKVVKKYAQLKTLTTNISKPARLKNNQSTSKKETSSDVNEVKNTSDDFSKKKYEVLKVSPVLAEQVSHMPHMMELETPRKIENCFDIPPTPRVLSPSSNTITPFTKMIEDSSNVRSFVNTPDFPPTPSIALTPKVIGDNTTDGAKRGEYSTCSPYYQPSTEPEVLDKLLGCQSNRPENKFELVSEASAVNVEMTANNANIDIANDFHMSTSSSQLEITQFEVIKENLPKEEAVKELKITTTSVDSIEKVEVRTDNVAVDIAPTPVEPKSVAATVQEDIGKRLMNSHESSSESDDEGTNSDTSSSSNSSSTSSSSSSNSSSMTTTSTPFPSTKKCKKTHNEIYTDSSNESVPQTQPVTVEASDPFKSTSPIMKSDIPQSNNIVEVLNTMPPTVKCETSPLKVFSVIKTAEEVDASKNETPAKDEALLSEANISETPSSSKSGIESLTNLNSKISAFNTPEDHMMLKQSRLSNKMHVPISTKTKPSVQPKIIGVQRILPNVSIALKPPPSVAEVVNSIGAHGPNHLTLQPSEMPDGKLGIQLEEKRLRLLTALKPKTKPKPNLVSRKPKVKQHLPKEKEETKILEKNKHCTVKEGTKELKETKRSTVNQEVVKSSAKAEMNRKLTTGSIDDIKKKSKTKQCRVAIQKICTEQTTNKIVSEGINTEAVNRNKEEDAKKKSEDNTTTKALAGASKVERTKVGRGKERTEKLEQCQKVPGNRNVIQVQKRNEPKVTKLGTTSDAVENLNDKARPKATKEYKGKDVKDKEYSKNGLERDEKASNGNNKNTVQESSTDKLFSELVLSPNKEVKYDKKQNVAITDKPKNVTKSKVDHVKRDLFSDEEINEQRTTRSRTRQISDAQKTEVVVPQVEVVIEKTVVDKPKEQLSSVLECLKLVPTNKTVTMEEETQGTSSNNSFVNFNFVYDDTAPIKKKRRKYSSSELQFEATVELSDQNHRECKKLMSATIYEEILNIYPKPKKRVPTKKPTRSARSTKTEVSKKIINTPTISMDHLMRPLATSSPVVRPSAPKVAKIKIKTASIISKEPGKTLVKAGVDPKNDEKSKEESNNKARKRKLSNSEVNKQGEKKQRIADPQMLLNKLDLDKFLTSVHGPT